MPAERQPISDSNKIAFPLSSFFKLWAKELWKEARGRQKKNVHMKIGRLPGMNLLEQAGMQEFRFRANKDWETNSLEWVPTDG